MRVNGFIQRLTCTAGDLLALSLPRHCAGCEDVVESGQPLCESCQARLDALSEVPCCHRCASPLPDEAGPCGRCKDKGLPHFETISRLSTFDSTTRELIHGFKYGRRWPLAKWIGKKLLEQKRIADAVANIEVVVPVPLHWVKRLSRGFNQSELLAREIAGRTGAKVASAVRRITATPSQTAFHSRQARQRNLDNAFRLVRPDLLEGRRVLIVDDVMTSGATLQAVARTIQGGCQPAELRGLVIASANPLTTDLAP